MNVKTKPHKPGTYKLWVDGNRCEATPTDDLIRDMIAHLWEREVVKRAKEEIQRSMRRLKTELKDIDFSEPQNFTIYDYGKTRKNKSVDWTGSFDIRVVPKSEGDNGEMG